MPAPHGSAPPSSSDWRPTPNARRSRRSFISPSTRSPSHALATNIALRNAPSRWSPRGHPIPAARSRRGAPPPGSSQACGLEPLDLSPRVEPQGAEREDRVQHGLPRPVDGDIAAPPPSSSASGVSRLCSALSRRLPSPKPRRSCRPNRWLAVYLSRKKLAGIKFHWRHLNNYIAVMDGIMSSNRY